MVKKIQKKLLFRGFSSTGNNKSVLTDIEITKQDLINHFQTRKTERVMFPNFGSIIWDRIFDQFNEFLRDEIVEDYNLWYDGLNAPQKLLVDASPVPDIIDRLEAADGSSIIRYGIDKQVKERWNGLVGIQYQYNKHWMLRSEAGIIGDRKSFLVSLNYRFLL